MKPSSIRKQQRGIVLVVAILFLLILTMISVFSASNSALELKMSGNMQDSHRSFQAAEAGALATLALAGTIADPFDGVSTNQDPFDDWANSPELHPLKNLSTDNTKVKVNMTLTSSATICPRRQSNFSIGLLSCDYYDIKSSHFDVQKSQTQIHLGVVTTNLKKEF